jgi:hypothetical protein
MNTGLSRGPGGGGVVPGGSNSYHVFTVQLAHRLFKWDVRI